MCDHFPKKVRDGQLLENYIIHKLKKKTYYLAFQKKGSIYLKFCSWITHLYLYLIIKYRTQILFWENSTEFSYLSMECLVLEIVLWKKFIKNLTNQSK